MRLSASYHMDEAHRKLCDEIRYTTGTIDSAIDFSERNPDKKVIIECLSVAASNLTYEKIAALINENPNWVLDCYELNEFIQFSSVHHVQKIMYHYPVNTFNDIFLLMSYHPYAISISEPLTFQCQMVRESVDSMTLEGQYTLIRVHPALGRPTKFDPLRQIDDGIRHFWVPPHMTDVYEPYIDVFDLFDKNTVREQALVDAYTKQKDTYSLRILCSNVDSDSLAIHWGTDEIKRRVNCGQACMRKPSNCHYCDRVAALLQLAKPNSV